MLSREVSPACFCAGNSSDTFSVTTDDGKSMALDESDAAILPDFVAKAHENVRMALAFRVM